MKNAASTRKVKDGFNLYINGTKVDNGREGSMLLRKQMLDYILPCVTTDIDAVSWYMEEGKYKLSSIVTEVLLAIPHKFK